MMSPDKQKGYYFIYRKVPNHLPSLEHWSTINKLTERKMKDSVLRATRTEKSRENPSAEYGAGVSLSAGPKNQGQAHDSRAHPISASNHLLGP